MSNIYHGAFSENSAVIDTFKFAFAIFPEIRIFHVFKLIHIMQNEHCSTKGNLQLS